ncbi:MAG: YitT family protein [Chlamydiae bacterium]|jgi:uncharacterized membrane-anchored protein YitT (DUF2179 family)|nr:YitT family protein [Chlamydiota bacterium]
MAHLGITKKKPLQLLAEYFGIALGAFLGALSIRVFLYPNQLIDGGVVGISLILGRLTNDSFISLYLILLNLPFVYLAYRYIRRTFVIQMLVAIALFAFFLSWLEIVPPFHGDSLEIIAIGGAILGIGAGLIIRFGGCTDGSEILGIIANKRFGFTVGQVVLVFNFFVFTSYGLIFLDWHIAVKSLLTYIVAFKMIDLVIVGLEEIKSVTVISTKSKEISAAILEELGLGLTITSGRGGYTGEERNILNVIVERLDLADLKELVLKIDQYAFISISNIYEVVYSHKTKRSPFRRKRKTKSLT